MDVKLQSLIYNCLNNRRSAQMELYGCYAPKLYPICCRIVGNGQEAEEVLQDAFLKVFSSLSTYDQSRAFDGWIKTIVTRTAIDHIRKEPFEWEDLDESHGVESEEEDDQQLIENKISRIKQAMCTLPSGYRAVLSLYLFEGYDMEEIADILEIKPASVRSQYLRAKQKLLQLLQHENHG